ncbi:MAG: MBL fold metallo-hydrolase, partial [Candidatus Humimicrobiaceae bacterium]
VNESKALNYDTTPKIIIASSGMCEGGRIRHHLKQNLWRDECVVFFVGYQANGTLGRMLLDGEKRVELFGEEIAVNASIYNFTGLSAHADRAGLLEWVDCFERKPDRIFVVHGEESVTEAFVNTLEGLGHSAVAPGYEEVYELGSG